MTIATGLKGKIALVTGGDRGIGRAIALALAEAGVHVAVNFRTRQREAEEVRSQIEALGQRSVAVGADVSAADQVSSMVENVQKELGPIGILVNNAGIARAEPVEEITEQSWDEVLAVNLKSQFLLIQAVLPAMRTQRWGRIINISSTAAQVGGVVGPHYAASKAGILGLTRYYAAFLAKEGITVNAIAPAFISTEMVANIPNAKPELVPQGRFGTAEEVAAVAVMLAGNGYITGQTINVNGGRYMS
ncbi:MAG TPA: 3-oxoacyl-ACP reductase family protein [Desulfomonilaceae bacterium]|nr:3-oxoacyl-ACP reductase family protein [Desulfomonilaceae bacterium]